MAFVPELVLACCDPVDETADGPPTTCPTCGSGRFHNGSRISPAGNLDICITVGPGLTFCQDDPDDGFVPPERNLPYVWYRDVNDAPGSPELGVYDDDDEVYVGNIDGPDPNATTVSFRLDDLPSSSDLGWSGGMSETTPWCRDNTCPGESIYYYFYKLGVSEEERCGKIRRIHEKVEATGSSPGGERATEFEWNKDGTLASKTVPIATGIFAAGGGGISGGGGGSQDADIFTVSGGENAGKIEQVITYDDEDLEHERTFIEYYDTNDVNASIEGAKVGSLKYVAYYVNTSTTIDEPTWVYKSGEYYRYYVAHNVGGNLIGIPGAVRLIVDNRGVAAAIKADPNIGAIADLDTLDLITEIDDYASQTYKYEGDTGDDHYGKVAESTGTGCGSCGGSPTGQYTYAYTDHTPTEENRNSWVLKTVVTDPDSHTTTYYTNKFGQVMLEVFAENGTANKWRTFTKYDSAGRVTLRAMPSAVNGHNEADDHLVDEGVDDTDIRDSQGLIHGTTYAANTTATTGSAGDVAGRVKKQWVQEGDTGDEITLREYTYIKHAGDDYAEFRIDTETVHVQDGTLTTVQTKYAYDWYDGIGSDSSNDLEETIVKQSAVAAARNGENVVDERRQYFNTDGTVQWTKDENNRLTYFEYADGRVSKRYDDAKTNVGGRSYPAVTGWPANTGGQDLLTEYTYDDLGRLLRTLGPEHDAVASGTTESAVRHASWTVYKEDTTDKSTQVWQGSGYLSGSTYVLVGAVSISVDDWDGKKSHQRMALRTTAADDELTAGDAFAQSGWLSWSTSIYDGDGQLEESRVYHAIPSAGEGSAGTNYEKTLYTYDGDTGRQIAMESPGGTIRRTTYDARGRQIGVYVGTDDENATADNPLGSGSNNNMALVTEFEYDADGVGDGHLTTLTQHVDGSTTRVTEYEYDFRGRRKGEDGPGNRYIAYTLDRLGRAYVTKQFDGSSSGDLLAQSETMYDERGQVYRTKVYAINTSTHTAGNALTTDNWYDAGGRLIKSVSGGNGKIFTKYAYDALGRQTHTHVGYDTDETAYPDPNHATDPLLLDGDTIIQETITTYNEVGQVLLSTAYARTPGATGTDQLSSLGAANWRRTYGAAWYDGAGRQIVSAAYGTNGGSSMTHSTTVASRSDTVLVTSMDYDDLGRAHQVTDPAARVTRSFYDDAGRQTHVVENYKSGGSYWTNDDPDQPLSRSGDINRITKFVYNADGRVIQQIAFDPAADGSGTSSDDQITKYIYGTEATAATPAIYSNDLLAAVIYPESTNTYDSGTKTFTNGANGYDRIELKYNRQGQVTERKDQRETVHAMTYDALGRLTVDTVTDLGRAAEKVDASVRRIDRTYNARGLLTDIVSYANTAGTGTPVNEVEYTYNEFNQLLTDEQEHNGAAGASTPQVAYAYASGSGTTNHIRPTTITYPNSRVITLDYGTANGTDDLLNRVAGIKDGSTVLASYSYIGAGTVVRKHLEDTASTGDNGIQLSYWNSIADPDTYPGLDDFGRVVQQRWERIDDGTPGPAGTHLEDVWHAQHDYDRNSNRQYAARQVYTSDSEVYDYDELDRLESYKAGLIKSSNDGTFNEWTLRGRQWVYDQVGNQTQVKNWDRGTNAFVKWVEQTHNLANEIVDRDVKGDDYTIPAIWDTDFASAPTSGFLEKVAGSTSPGFTVTGGKLELDIGTGTTKVLFGGAIGPIDWKFDAEPATQLDDEGGFIIGYQSASVETEQRIDYKEVQVIPFPPIVETFTDEDFTGGIDHTEEYDSAKTTFKVSGWSNSIYNDGQRFNLTTGDGFPSGRLGVFADDDAYEFDNITVTRSSIPQAVTDRWLSHYGKLSGVNIISPYPMLLPSLRADRWEVTLKSVGSTPTIIFNATEYDDFDYMHLGTSQVLAFEMENGKVGAVVTGTHTGNTISGTGDTWYRVYCDGTTVTVLAQISATKPTTWDTTDDKVWSSDNFDVIGGMLGLDPSQGTLSDHDITIKTDTNSDGTYDTTQHVEDFGVNGSNMAEDVMEHDAAGNMIYDGRYVYTYDAWNRMVTVTKAYPDADADDHAEEGSLIATMVYDGLGRRVSKAVENSGDLDCTYHYYYAGHSLVEEHDGSQNVLKQYVWGRMYIDELVQIGVNDDPEDEVEDDVESFFYALHNANFNVAALTDDDGVIVERYEYDPYGQRQVFISTGDNDPQAHGAVAMSQRVVADSGVQAYALNPFGHQGLYHDEAIELIYNRARMLNPRVGRFMQWDMAGYKDGMGLYTAHHSLLGLLDPSGLAVERLSSYVQWQHWLALWLGASGEWTYGGYSVVTSVVDVSNTAVKYKQSNSRHSTPQWVRHSGDLFRTWFIYLADGIGTEVDCPCLDKNGNERERFRDEDQWKGVYLYHLHGVTSEKSVKIEQLTIKVGAKAKAGPLEGGGEVTVGLRFVGGSAVGERFFDAVVCPDGQGGLVLKDATTDEVNDGWTRTGQRLGISHGSIDVQD